MAAILACIVIGGKRESKLMDSQGLSSRAFMITTRQNTTLVIMAVTTSEAASLALAMIALLWCACACFVVSLCSVVQTHALAAPEPSWTRLHHRCGAHCHNQLQHLAHATDSSCLASIFLSSIVAICARAQDDSSPACVGSNGHVVGDHHLAHTSMHALATLSCLH